jgi:haloacetate dehalogenase
MPRVTQDTDPAVTALLPGFERRRVIVDGITINCAIKGSGQPLLLLHGYPENRLTWRHVAPGLAEDHTVVVADLRGYGESDKPAPDSSGLVYSKRSMARDQVGLMRQLGFEQFQLVGHDRGARVAHRLALDHPTAVTRVAILDVLPTLYSYSHVTRAVASTNFFWFFMANDTGLPEHMIGIDSAYWLRALMTQLMGEGARIEPQVMDDYIRCFRDPRAIAGSCADFRASASTDLVHDQETSAAGRKIECPVLVLWGTQSTGSDPLGIWQQYASSVCTKELPTGHFLPEEAPDLVSGALHDFLD